MSAWQLMAATGISADMVYRRLRVLRAKSLVAYERPFQDEPGVFSITAAGLAVARSDLPVPRLDLRTHRHDLLVVDAAQQFADRHPELVLVTERQLRSDGRRGHQGRPELGVRLGGYGRDGQRRVHYPDAVFLDNQGCRVAAIEVELSSKGRTRLEKILAAYAMDRDIDQVVYLTDRHDIAAAVRRAAKAKGAGALLKIWRLADNPDAAPAPVD